MGRFRLTVTAVLLVAAGAALGQTHPGQLPALAPDAVFPRCSDSQLAVAGFPDHRHEQHWSTWTPRSSTVRCRRP